jgi:hypothetical protein
MVILLRACGRSPDGIGEIPAIALAVVPESRRSPVDHQDLRPLGPAIVEDCKEMAVFSISRDWHNECERQD